MFTKLIIICAVIFCASAKHHEKFQRYLEKHGKKYDSLPEEVRLRRQANYLKNLDNIERHNKDPKHHFKLGSNEYTDRDNQRFVEDMCRTELPASPRALPRPPYIYAPTTPARVAVDYRSSMQPIANQGACGSCWAFASVATIESYNKIRGRVVTPLSQQNVVDCDTVDKGCNGGWPTNTFNFLKNNYGKKLATNAQYPYTSGSTKVAGACRLMTSYSPLYYNSVFQTNVNGNEALLKKIISNYGPVTIAMYVSSSGLFQNYRSGIFYDSSCPVSTATTNQCNTVNHAMVAVGYGKDAATNQEYWIIRNSWGTGWGEAGYIRMAIGRGNNCNVACYAMGIE